MAPFVNRSSSPKIINPLFRETFLHLCALDIPRASPAKLFEDLREKATSDNKVRSAIATAASSFVEAVLPGINRDIALHRKDVSLPFGMARGSHTFRWYARAVVGSGWLVGSVIPQRELVCYGVLTVLTVNAIQEALRTNRSLEPVESISCLHTTIDAPRLRERLQGFKGFITLRRKVEKAT